MEIGREGLSSDASTDPCQKAGHGSVHMLAGVKTGDPDFAG